MQQPEVPPPPSRYRPPSVLPVKCCPHRFKLSTAAVRSNMPKISGHQAPQGIEERILFATDVWSGLQGLNFRTKSISSTNGSLSSDRWVG